MFAIFELFSSVAAILLSILVSVDGHGRLINPPGRSTMWRYADSNDMIKPYKSIIDDNYQDNELFCGGFQHQQSLGGKCGICGDPYDAEPRENEAGGMYAKGIIVAQYAIGEKITIQVQITAAHKGFFEFRLCPMNDPTSPATKECLDKYLLKTEEGQTKWYLPEENEAKTYSISVKLPESLECSQCVLQWRYHTGNSWGCNEPNDCGIGCGPQEEFYGCADIAIGGEVISPPTIPATEGSHTTTTTITSEAGGGEPEPECTNGEYLPIDGECNKFYWCVNSMLVVQECPEGTVVTDDQDGPCDLPFAVSPPCGVKTSGYHLQISKSEFHTFVNFRRTSSNAKASIRSSAIDIRSSNLIFLAIIILSLQRRIDSEGYRC